MRSYEAIIHDGPRLCEPHLFQLLNDIPKGGFRESSTRLALNLSLNLEVSDGAGSSRGDVLLTVEKVRRAVDADSQYWEIDGHFVGLELAGSRVRMYHLRPGTFRGRYVPATGKGSLILVADFER